MLSDGFSQIWKNLLHQKVNTNEFASNGQSRVPLVEQIVLKIKPELAMTWDTNLMADS